MKVSHSHVLLAQLAFGLILAVVASRLLLEGADRLLSLIPLT